MELENRECPTCKRSIRVVADLDGFGRENGPLRFLKHVGLQWGRTCKGSGELVGEGK